MSQAQPDLRKGVKPGCYSWTPAISRKAIRRLAKKHPQAEIIVIGCYAARAAKEAAAMPGDRGLIGQFVRVAAESVAGGWIWGRVATNTPRLPSFPV